MVSGMEVALALHAERPKGEDTNGHRYNTWFACCAALADVLSRNNDMFHREHFFEVCRVGRT